MELTDKLRQVWNLAWFDCQPQTYLLSADKPKGLRALKAKNGPLQKWFIFANRVAILMQVSKIKVKKVTGTPFRKYLGPKLNATSAF